MPKTGSTSIQFALTRNRENLLAAGILYPSVPDPFAGHEKHMLYLSMLRQGDAGQWTKHPEIRNKIASTFDGGLNFFDFWLKDLKSQIANTKPHTLIISDEGFFNGLANKKSNVHKNLRQLLVELHVDPLNLEIVGYLRSPPDYYLSRAQQTLKTTSKIIPLTAANYIPAIKRIKSEYKSRLTLFPFNRSIFPQGDVVRHFTDYSIGFELESFEQINETVSGPAMCILQEYHDLYSIETSKKRNPKQVQFLINTLRDAGAALCFGRPTLRSDVKMTIWKQVRSDLEWLDQTYGFNFIGPDETNSKNSMIHDDSWQPKTLSDIIECSQDEKNRLLFELIFQMSKAKGKKLKNTKSSL